MQGWGSAQLCRSPMQGTSACASTATRCCREGIPCSLSLSLLPSKATCYSFCTRMGFFQVSSMAQRQQNYSWAAALLLLWLQDSASLMFCPALLPCTKHCLESAPASFPPYGLSSHPHPPCSEAFPMEAFREMQPPSLPSSAP